jgi:hypothetical protein
LITAPLLSDKAISNKKGFPVDVLLFDQDQSDMHFLLALASRE